MRSITHFLLAAGFAALTLIAQPVTSAKAALIHDLYFIDEAYAQGVVGTGILELPSDYGSCGEVDVQTNQVDCNGVMLSLDIMQPDMPGYAQIMVVEASWAVDDNWLFEPNSYFNFQDSFGYTDQLLFTSVNATAMISIGTCSGVICGDLVVNGRPLHVPEPGTLALFVIALGGLGFLMRRWAA